LYDILFDMISKKLIKHRCEIWGCPIDDPNALELHHIIGRTETGSSHYHYNLGVLCCNHHKFIDSGRLVILGVVPATVKPNNRILVYILDGVKNIDIDIPDTVKPVTKYSI